MLGLTTRDTWNPPPFPSVLFESFVVFLACCLVAVLFNGLRKNGIPFTQTAPHEILVPCPETMGDAEPIPAGHQALSEKRTLLLDARPASDHALWHPAGSWNAPFDYLLPTDETVIRRLAASGAARIVVFGDGHDPDSGEQLAREISGRGIRNVGYVPGGASALGAPKIKRAKP